jgi:hypothetical protein
MYRKFALVIAAMAALVVAAPGAQAQGRHHTDPRLKAVGIGVGAASAATYFGINHWSWKWNTNAAGLSQGGAIALTTVGCMAVSPILGTIVLNRPLTMREAHVLAVSCIIPIIGGWLVNAAYDAHPEWEAGEKPSAPVRVTHRKKRM